MILLQCVLIFLFLSFIYNVIFVKEKRQRKIVMMIQMAVVSACISYATVVTAYTAINQAILERTDVK